MQPLVHDHQPLGLLQLARQLVEPVQRLAWEWLLALLELKAAKHHRLGRNHPAWNPS